MTFLPIVDRELRVAARRKGTHWLWVSAAAAASAIFYLLVIGMEASARIQQFGSGIFTSVSILAFVFTLIAGVFLTADCLCSERRDGTIGLLFLTDLRGYDVVLGKLVATSMVSAYALLAIIPVLGLSLLLGGVSWLEFARMVLALLVTLFFSLALGMFASGVSRDTRGAMFLGFGAMFAFTGVLSIAAGLAYWNLRSSVVIWLLSPGPLPGFMGAFDLLYQRSEGAAQYWTSILSMTTIGVSLLWITSVLLPRSLQDGHGEAARTSSNSRTRTRPFAGPMTANPFAWLSSRDLFPGKWMRLIFSALFGIWLLCFIGSWMSTARKSMEFFITAFVIAFGLQLLVKGLVAVQATRRLCEDRHSGALELLLGTALTPEEIVAGQWQTLRRQFRPFLWALTLVNLALTVMAPVFRPANMGIDVAVTFSLFFLGGIVLLWVDHYAIGWFGMWTAIRGARPHRAVFNTMARILGPPSLALFFFFALTISGMASSLETAWICWLLWLLLSVVSSHVAVVDRKIELLQDFRWLAVGDEPVKVFQPWSPEWESPPAETQASPPPVTTQGFLR
jgi:ABC-type transport system involved in multi-copper enzyme maturation permease subunit